MAHNRDFIARARQDLPALVAYAQEQLAALRAVAGRKRDGRYVWPAVDSLARALGIHPPEEA